MQGDVIAIVDSNAETVARYSYDAWGVPTITQDTSGCQIATINPFRYRGYYFDEEIGLYYLQSRYYDANIGRFVNGDDVYCCMVCGQAYSNNAYSYCANDCVNGKDETGFIPWRVIIAVSAGIALGVYEILKTVKTREYKRATGGGKALQLIVSFLLGFIRGASATFFAMLAGVVGKSIGAGILALLVSLIKAVYGVFAKGKKVTVGGATDAFISGYNDMAYDESIVEEVTKCMKKGIAKQAVKQVCSRIIEAIG